MDRGRNDMTNWRAIMATSQIAQAPRASIIQRGRTIPNVCQESPHKAMITSTGAATCSDRTIKYAM